MSEKKLPDNVVDIFKNKDHKIEGPDWKAVSHEPAGENVVETKHLIRFLVMLMQSEDGNRSKVLGLVDQIAGTTEVTPDLYAAVTKYMNLVREGEK